MRGMFFQPEAEQRRWQALVLANSNVAMLQHGEDGTSAGCPVACRCTNTRTLHAASTGRPSARIVHADPLTAMLIPGRHSVQPLATCEAQTSHQTPSSRLHSIQTRSLLQ